VNLTSLQNSGPEGEAHTSQIDLGSWERLDELVIREAKAGHREEIWATFTGIARAPDSYALPDGHVTPGYGHLGSLPVELFVERVSDVTVRSSPTYDYAELLRAKAR
jgi:hypothetical protein